jgi:hypothetical protein
MPKPIDTDLHLTIAAITAHLPLTARVRMNAQAECLAELDSCERMRRTQAV